MTDPIEPGIDWSLCTWKGSRRKQHQEFYAIPFSRKLEIMEEMADAGRATIESLRKQGLPYIDPYTGKHVSKSSLREEPSPGLFSPENS